MKRILFFALLFSILGSLRVNAQIQLMPNFVSTQEFNTDKEIWPTFTKGVVHYEAEIMYIYGEVYVTSQMPDSANHTRPTLRSTYLLPIYSQYKKNQGKVHPNFDDEMYLFLNIKYDPKKTYYQVWEQLSPYHEMLTYRVGPQWHEGKLKVIFVGNAPMRTFQQERVCFVAAQGSVADLDKNYDNKMMPLIGIDFEEELDWNGVGKMPFDEYKSFKDIVNKAHDQGKKVRVYNLPDDEAIWEVMYTAGVDMISGIDATRFHGFLETKK
ncbi:PI-PLC domain-containing protein [Roseimarinus sediminis]|uniref:hypothetical protein n=1 Tax=Roseimarinus sediminis TaxID=1610899 RepID=UPI003D1F6C0F